MKLESLKSSKFEAFKGSEIVNAMSIKGGQCERTFNKSGGAECDTFNSDWSKRANGTINEPKDWGEINDTRCQVGTQPPVGGGGTIIQPPTPTPMP